MTRTNRRFIAVVAAPAEAATTAYISGKVSLPAGAPTDWFKGVTVDVVGGVSPNNVLGTTKTVSVDPATGAWKATGLKSGSKYYYGIRYVVAAYASGDSRVMPALLGGWWPKWQLLNNGGIFPTGDLVHLTGNKSGVNITMRPGSVISGTVVPPGGWTYPSAGDDDYCDGDLCRIGVINAIDPSSARATTAINTQYDPSITFENDGYFADVGGGRTDALWPVGTVDVMLDTTSGVASYLGTVPPGTWLLEFRYGYDAVRTLTEELAPAFYDGSALAGTPLVADAVPVELAPGATHDPIDWAVTRKAVVDIDLSFASSAFTSTSFYISTRVYVEVDLAGGVYSRVLWYPDYTTTIEVPAGVAYTMTAYAWVDDTNASYDGLEYGTISGTALAAGATTGKAIALGDVSWISGTAIFLDVPARTYGSGQATLYRQDGGGWDAVSTFELDFDSGVTYAQWAFAMLEPGVYTIGLEGTGSTGRAWPERYYGGPGIAVATLAAATTVTATSTLSGYFHYNFGFSATSAITASGTSITRPEDATGSVAQVGEQLTVHRGTWTPDPVTTTVQWYRSGKAISGAKSDTYTVTNADRGKSLTVKVTGTRKSYTTKVVTPVAVKVVGTFSKAPKPTISPSSKTPAVGVVLTAKPGTWAPTKGTTLSYQWLRGGVAIDGATAKTYATSDADTGPTHAISVQVTATNATLQTRATTSSAYAIPVPFATTVVAVAPVAFAAVVGETVKVDLSGWTPTPTAKYQWYRAGKAIGGATKSSYLISTKDAGRALTVRVVGSGFGLKTATIVSGPVAIPAVPTAKKVTLTGTPSIGQTLTATLTGSWTPAAEESYQWFRGAVPIDGETGLAHEVVADDTSTTLTFQVYAHGETASRVVAASVKVGKVFGNLTVAIPSTGTVGHSVTATVAVTPAATLTYQWFRGDAPIPKATARTYKPVSADAGMSLTLQVTATKPGYQTTSRMSSHAMAIPPAS